MLKIKNYTLETSNLVYSLYLCIQSSPFSDHPVRKSAYWSRRCVIIHYRTHQFSVRVIWTNYREAWLSPKLQIQDSYPQGLCCESLKVSIYCPIHPGTSTLVQPSWNGTLLGSPLSFHLYLINPVVVLLIQLPSGLCLPMQTSTPQGYVIFFPKSSGSNPSPPSQTNKPSLP